MTKEFINHQTLNPPHIIPPSWEHSHLEPIIEIAAHVFSIQTHCFPEIITDRHSPEHLQIIDRVMTQNSPLRNQNKYCHYLYLDYPHPLNIAAQAGYLLGYQSQNFPLVIATYDRQQQIAMIKLQGHSARHPSSWVSYTYLSGHPHNQNFTRQFRRSLTAGALPSNFMFNLASHSFPPPNSQMDISIPKTTNLLTIVGCEFITNDQGKKEIIEGTATCITQPLLSQE